MIILALDQNHEVISVSEIKDICDPRLHNSYIFSANECKLILVHELQEDRCVVNLNS